MELSCEQRRKQNIADNRRILAEIGLLNPVNIICIHFYFDRITIPKVFTWRIIPTLTFVHILVRPIFNQCLMHFFPLLSKSTISTYLNYILCLIVFMNVQLAHDDLFFHYHL